MTLGSIVASSPLHSLNAPPQRATSCPPPWTLMGSSRKSTQNRKTCSGAGVAMSGRPLHRRRGERAAVLRGQHHRELLDARGGVELDQRHEAAAVDVILRHRAAVAPHLEGVAGGGTPQR